MLMECVAVGAVKVTGPKYQAQSVMGPKFFLRHNHVFYNPYFVLFFTVFTSGF